MTRNEFLKDMGFKGSALFALYCSGTLASCSSSTEDPTPVTTESFTIDLTDTANANL